MHRSSTTFGRLLTLCLVATAMSTSMAQETQILVPKAGLMHSIEVGTWAGPTTETVTIAVRPLLRAPVVADGGVELLGWTGSNASEDYLGPIASNKVSKGTFAESRFGSQGVADDGFYVYLDATTVYSRGFLESDQDNTHHALVKPVDYGFDSDDIWIPFKDLSGGSNYYHRRARKFTGNEWFTITVPRNSGGATIKAYFVSRYIRDVKLTSNSNWTLNIPLTHTAYAPVTVKEGYLKAAPVDTRTLYGQPDGEGTVEPDPNSVLRHATFPSWKIYGGLFLGNSETPPPSQGQGNSQAEAKQDKSGIARILAQPGTAPSTPDGMTFSALSIGLYDLGLPNRSGFKPTSYNTMSILAEVGSGPSWTNENLLSYADVLTESGVVAGATVNMGAPNYDLTGVTNDICGSTGKYYFWGASAYNSSTHPYFQLRLADENTIGRWRYFVGNSYTAAEGMPTSAVTFYNKCKPVAGYAYLGATVHND